MAPLGLFPAETNRFDTKGVKQESTRGNDELLKSTNVEGV